MHLDNNRKRKVLNNLAMMAEVNQFTQHLRRFVYDSYTTFQQLPKGIDYHVSSDAERIGLHQASVRFRTHLQGLAADLNNNMQSNSHIDHLISNANVVCFEDCHTIYSIEKSWHLCEIFSINESDMLSIELIKWLKDVCYDFKEIPLEHILNADEPESVETISSVCLGYWDAVYSNAMQGETSTVVQLLRVHSEISQIYATDHGILTSSAATKAQCDAFFDLLESHPYALLASSFDFVAQIRESSSAAVVSTEFSSWHKRAQKLRMAGSGLLVSIPELDTILRILLGEHNTLEQCSGLAVGREWAWGRLAIALLLYVHPPPLTRPDLCRILEDCIWKQSEVSDGTDIERGYMRTLKEVMTGNLAPALRSMFQLGTTQSNQKCAVYCDLSLIPLLCAAHLSLLLAGSLSREDLFIPMPDSANEVSFFEEIFLESAQRLHSAQFSCEMIINYLALCPMRGREFARVLLPLMETHSDRSTFAVVAALRGAGVCVDEADALLRARGMWWLTSSPPPPLSLASTPSASTEQLLRSSTLAKAAMFFLAAGDLPRVGALFKGSLARCMWAVVSCTSFKGLSFCPGNDSLWANDLKSAYLSSGEFRTSEDCSLELNAALNEAKELQDALGEATLCGVTDLHRTALVIYTSAIKSWIKPAQQGPMSRQAMILLSNLLLTEEFRAPLASIKHWLHVLELIVWLSNCTARYEDRSGALSKDRVYALLTVFQEAKHSYGAKHLQEVVQSENLERSMQSLQLGLLGLLSCSIVEDNSRSFSVIGSRGKVKRVNKYSNGEVSRFKAHSNFVSAGMDVKNRVKQTDAFELLTGSNLFAYIS